MSLLDLFDATPPAEIRLQVAAPAAVLDALDDEALPRFAAAWGATNDATLVIEPIVGDAVALSRRVTEDAGLDVVILPAVPGWLVLEEAGFVEPESLVLLASDTVAIGVRAGNPLGIDGWGALERTGARLVLPGAGAHTRAHLLLGGLWQGVTEEEPGFPAVGEAALARALREASSREGTADAAIRRFVDGEGDATLGEARALRAAGIEVVVPPVTLRSPIPAGVVTPEHPDSAEHRAARALVRALQGPAAQAALARAGFDPVPEAGADAGRWFDMARAVRLAGVVGPAVPAPVEPRAPIRPAPRSTLHGWLGAVAALVGGLGVLLRQVLHGS